MDGRFDIGLEGGAVIRESDVEGNFARVGIRPGVSETIARTWSCRITQENDLFGRQADIVVDDVGLRCPGNRRACGYRHHDR